jgi:hypothetical protein
MGRLLCPSVLQALTPVAQRGVTFSPNPLAYCGLIFQVSVSPSVVAPIDEPTEAATPSAVVFALLDTGATYSSIDVGLADFLNLKITGMSRMMTAAGPTEAPNHVVDLHFPGSSLAPFIHLPITSCQIGFDVNADRNNPRNFAMLIGRDVMARWSIGWYGPTSTVMIND